MAKSSSLVSHIIEPLIDALIIHTKIGLHVTYNNASLMSILCTLGRLGIKGKGCIVAVPSQRCILVVYH